MRKQYHSRPSDRGRLIWDVHRLVRLSTDFPRRQVPVEEIVELDQNFWFQNGAVQPTVRAVAEHAKLIEETDLAHPIILCAEGRVMDGMHRVAKAFIRGHSTIDAVQFEENPLPDFVGVDLDALPYDDPA